MALNSDRLKKLRKEHNVLQKQVAELLGITERQYRSYEAGKVDPPTSKTMILANYFNVSIDFLVGISDDATRR